ncbi:MAG TPA: hypothetical protein VG267_10840 [Terracidiphilus sp.]|nr:hypothetical protein [Terracidiphilus sp.]
MNSRMKAAAAIVLAACIASSYSYAGDPPAKKHTVHKKVEKGPTVEEQIDVLRQQLQGQQGQIDALKSNLATKDEQLRQAQQQAVDAQAAATKAEQDATAQEQATSQNMSAVSTLQSTVTDLKANQTSLAVNLSDETANIKKQIANPDAIHFKGSTISFTGSFVAAETVWRQGATGGDVNTPFTSVPLQFADNAQLTEFYGSGRQSRFAMKAVGKLPNWTMTGYYEADWLSAGVTSNNNQSNSYTMRQRQLWADAKTNTGWDFSGGQGWSLVTETTQGLTRGTEVLPGTIDAQYTAGFVWGRQESFRISKNFGKKFFLGASAENAQTLNPAGSGLPTNYVMGSAGTGGGLYNATTNYSFNYAPDFVAKLAFEPGWGHWELFGIGRTFRNRIYPNETCTTSATGTVSCTNTTGAYNDSSYAGGIGGGFRVPLANKKLVVGLKGLWGQGVGRYGSSTIADVTLRPDAQISPLHAFSALSTVELNPNPRLNVYFNYGGDYVSRNYVGKVGYGSRLTSMTGCNTEVPPSPSNSGNPFAGQGGFNGANPAGCGNQNKDVQEFAAGDWYYLYRGPQGGLRFGLQYARFERDLWSGAGGPLNPSGGAKGIDNMFWTSFRYYLP